MKLSLLISVCFIFFCCKQEYEGKKYTITKFDKIICDTIKPKKGSTYVAKMIQVKGYADDSIFVSFGGKYYNHYLSKDIDTIIITDYYGESNGVFIFNPYKARKGKLKIEFGL
jgi:hypothetical protein